MNTGPVRVIRTPRQTLVVALAMARDCDIISERERQEALDWMDHPDGCKDEAHRG